MMGESPSSSSEQRVCLGVIVGAHGIKGAIKVKPFTEFPDEVASYGPLTDEDGNRVLDLTLVGVSGGTVVCTVAGIEDRTAAERLRGVRLCVSREALPELEDDETFYHSDLIGLPVVFTDGMMVGKVVALHDFGAGDVLEIGGEAGGSVMVPFTRAAVPEVNIKEGKVVVERLPGLLEEPITSKEVKDAAKRAERIAKSKTAEAEGETAEGPEEDWPEEDWR